MRLANLFTYTAIIFFSCSPTQSKKEEISQIIVKGSESLHEPFEEIKSAFEKENPGISVRLEGGGSAVGLRSVHAREADIGLWSFDFDLLKELGPTHSVSRLPLAYDGIVLITNSFNPTISLSDSVIKYMYSGELTSWKSINNIDFEVKPVSRDSNSGTQRFFTEHFNIKQLSRKGLTADNNTEIVNYVKSDSGAIGFIGFAYFTNQVNHLSLEKESIGVIEPAMRTILDDSYPLKRKLGIYFQNEPTNESKLFIDFLKSGKTKSILESYGLISIN